MDKKNTMLLTVIAVATLLVAVVGATFAYFAISTGDSVNNSKTTITGSTEGTNVGSIALKGNKALTMNLTAENMASAHQGKAFYASESGTVVMDEEQKLTVGTATLTGGDSGIVYECTATYKVTYDDSEDNIQWSDGLTEQSELGDDKAVLTLSGKDTNVTLEGDIASPLKLKDLATAEAGKTGTVKFKLTGNGGEVTADLLASLSITNSEKDQSTRLADKTFTINIEATEFSCDTVKAGQ